MSTSTRRPRPAGPSSRMPDQPAAPVQIAAVPAGDVQAGRDRSDPVAAQLLAASPAYDRQTAARLHRRLEVAADRAGLTAGKSHQPTTSQVSAHDANV